MAAKEYRVQYNDNGTVTVSIPGRAGWRNYPVEDFETFISVVTILQDAREAYAHSNPPIKGMRYDSEQKKYFPIVGAYTPSSDAPQEVKGTGRPTPIQAG